MAEKKRVLIVAQEMQPYLSLSAIGDIVNQSALYLQDQDLELRLLMPRFGTINERRHRLHEVVRLSGMNITVDEDYYPLVIKVASLPGSRMQVYFLDNEEFFKRKNVFNTDEGEFFDDNLDRMFFFCKSVLETVKKFGWSPDIIHAHGWMTSLIPAYLKTAYKNEPVFQNTRFVYSAYNHEDVSDYLKAGMVEKAQVNQLGSAIDAYFQHDGRLDLNQGAAHYADGLVLADTSLNLAGLDIPTAYQQADDFENFLHLYQDLLVRETAAR
jgi:starch synthase